MPLQGGLQWQGGTLESGLQWQGSEYELVLLPPGITFDENNPVIPSGAITEDNYQSFVDYNVEFFNGYDSTGVLFYKPFKFFRVNNPGLGAWKYAILENEGPLVGEEPLRVYMSNESDLVLSFKTDKERYFLAGDSVQVTFIATLTQGGESLDPDEHTQTTGEAVDDAWVAIQVTAPNGEFSEVELPNEGNGKYTRKLATDVIGNYDVVVIASDNTNTSDPNQPRNNQYLITTEHSFYVSPYNQPEELDGRKLIEEAYNLIYGILDQYGCLDNGQGCLLPNNTKRDLRNAKDYLKTAIDNYFENGDHLKTNKGLNFYDKVTSSVNKIYSYVSNEDFGDDIETALEKLYQGSYRLARIARDEAVLWILAGNCQLSNCDETLKNANSELGKARDGWLEKNYPYSFNHLTNAWKFSLNIKGANLRKESSEEETELLPTEYGLDQNYPNPFNPSTTINYQLPEKNHVSLQIYDILGNLVTTLVNQDIEPGYHSITWNASGLASGVYIYRLISGSFISSKKLILMK